MTRKKKNDYTNWSKEELLKLVEKQDEELAKKKYGLVWDSEKEPEQVVLDCENNIPVLERVKDKEIRTDDSDDNILIEGDNYHALTCLNYTHKGKIDVIYIDPPYNTKQDGFIYNDKIVDINDGYRHSKYLNFMEKRLILSKYLLKNTGMVFISIGEDEQANLKLLCDKIFFEKNFVGTIARLTKKGGNKGDYLKPKKDYILCYFKDIEYVSKDNFGQNIANKEYKWKEEVFKGKKRRYIKGDIPYREKLETRKNQRYYIEAPDGTLIIPKGDIFPKIKKDGEQIIPKSENDKCWTWSKERYLKEKENNRFIFIKSKKSSFLDENNKQANWTIYKKVFEDELNKRKEILIDFIDSFPNSKGTAELDQLNLNFSFPKPTDLIKYLINIVSHKNAKILDFFAGSGTTAHAVLELNKEDNGNRKFILCTNNEVGILEETKFCQKYNITKKELENWKKEGKKEWIKWCEEYGICSTVTYPRIHNVIKGYKFTGKDKTLLFEKKLTFTQLKTLDKTLEEINKIIEENKDKFNEIKKEFKDNTIKIWGFKNIDSFKDGLGGNLQYFKTDLIPVDRIDNVGDVQRKKLTYKAGQMIAIKENTFEEVETNEWYQIFENKDKTRKTAIYFREDMDEFKKLVEKLGKTQTTLYVFSYGRVDKNVFKYLGKNIVIDDIPEPILEIYKEINLTLKDK